jgi:3'-5' exoribonuclease 1
MKTYIVFDLEATCMDREKFPEEAKIFPNEIIEIGAVKVNEQGEVIDRFNRFIKPILNPVLTDFCKKLTKIHQEDVDGAEGYPEVIQAFIEWIGKDYVLCSWGFYDKKQLRADNSLHSLYSDWVTPHISIKRQHQKLNKLPRGMGLQKALAHEGFRFEGTPHRGIDDAINIAKIFVKFLDKWKIGEE